MKRYMVWGELTEDFYEDYEANMERIQTCDERIKSDSYHEDMVTVVVEAESEDEALEIVQKVYDLENVKVEEMEE